MYKSFQELSSSWPLCSRLRNSTNNKVIVSLLCCSHYIQDAENRDARGRKAVVQSWLRVIHPIIIASFQSTLLFGRTAYPFQLVSFHICTHIPGLNAQCYARMIVRNKATDIEKWIFSFPFFMTWFRFIFLSLSFSRTSAGGCSLKR